MLVDYISDLHICFYIKEIDTNKTKFKNQLEYFISKIFKDKQADILVIAGDISHFNNVSKALLIELKKLYKEVIITFGNHDLYLVSKSQVAKYKSKSENRLIELQEICEELNVHFLNGQIITIDGIKFGGTGSWYNLKNNLEIKQWQKVMNDSRLIYNGYSVQPYGMYCNYSQPNKSWDTQAFWLKEESKLLDISEKGCDVFITHVGLNEPTLEEGMPLGYIMNKDNIFYYTNNIDLLKKSKCKVHIFGHTHTSYNYKKEGIQFVCNPCGYKGELHNPGVKTIEV